MEDLKNTKEVNKSVIAISIVLVALVGAVIYQQFQINKALELARNSAPAVFDVTYKAADGTSTTTKAGTIPMVIDLSNYIINQIKQDAKSSQETGDANPSEAPTKPVSTEKTGNTNPSNPFARPTSEQPK